MSDARDRRIPWSENAEQSVLAAIMLDSQSIMRVLELIDESMFYAEGHRKLFRAMVSLAESGTVIDPVTLSERMADRGELEAAGGKDYIAFLIDAVPTSANITYHAEIVREKAQLRRVIVAATTMQAEAYAASEKATTIAQNAFETLLPLSVEDSSNRGFIRVHDLVWPVMESVEASSGGMIQGMRTGYTRIDAETGGFLPGELVILGAVEGHGKSALALNIGLNVCLNDDDKGGGEVGYVSAEMSKTAITKRALQILGRVDGKRIRTGTLQNDDFPRLGRAAGLLSNAPLWIDDEAEPSLADVSARCTHLKALHPRLKLIIVDFLQLLRISGSEGKRHEQLQDIAYGLKGLAKRLGVVVAAPCQVNSKEVESGGDMRPHPKDLQGSSGMRQAADFIGLMYRPAVYKPGASPHDLEVYFAKAREAATFVAHLHWDGPTLCIDNPRFPERTA